MRQFIIIAEDGDDAEALNRRLSIRSSHLDGAKKLKEDNHYIVGGATLNTHGEMNGSVMIVQFENEQELQAWLEIEPYIKSRVWNKVQVKPFRIADV